jgi:hypothetical protein
VHQCMAFEAMQLANLGFMAGTAATTATPVLSLFVYSAQFRMGIIGPPNFLFLVLRAF